MPPTDASTAGQQGKACRNKHGYRGVRQRPWLRYAAEIRDGSAGKRRWVGTFETAAEAALAYDAVALTIHGAKARTNFTYSQQTREQFSQRGDGKGGCEDLESLLSDIAAGRKLPVPEEPAATRNAAQAAAAPAHASRAPRPRAGAARAAEEPAALLGQGLPATAAAGATLPGWPAAGVRETGLMGAAGGAAAAAAAATNQQQEQELQQGSHATSTAALEQRRTRSASAEPAGAAASHRHTPGGVPLTAAAASGQLGPDKKHGSADGHAACVAAAVLAAASAAAAAGSAGKGTDSPCSNLSSGAMLVWDSANSMGAAGGAPSAGRQAAALPSHAPQQAPAASNAADGQTSGPAAAAAAAAADPAPAAELPASTAPCLEIAPLQLLGLPPQADVLQHQHQQLLASAAAMSAVDLCRAAGVLEPHCELSMEQRCTLLLSLLSSGLLAPLPAACSNQLAAAASTAGSGLLAAGTCADAPHQQHQHQQVQGQEAQEQHQQEQQEQQEQREQQQQHQNATPDDAPACRAKQVRQLERSSTRRGR